MIKKVEDSIDINRIKDRSIEIKDAIMTNLTPLNQQDLTSRLKSFSGYQLNTAYNNLTKSASNQFMSKNNHPKNRTSNTNFECNNLITYPILDLDPFPEDDSFKPLSLKWWNFQYDGQIKTEEINIQTQDEILLDIQMSSCN